MKPQEISIPVTDSLINLVRAHGCIWNKSDPGYKNTLLKRQACELILEGLKSEFSIETLKLCDLATHEDVKKKLKNLRNTHQQYKKKLESKSGDGAIKVKPWIWYDALSFLQGSSDMAGLPNLRATSQLPGMIENVRKQIWCVLLAVCYCCYVRSQSKCWWLFGNLFLLFLTE